jgi:hypothetical protein
MRRYPDGMSEPLGPRRPLPKSVYVRRRIIVLVVLLALVVVIVIIAWPRGGSASTPEETSRQTTTPAATGTNSPECDPKKIQILAVTDKDVYGPGELPKMWLTLENKSSKECVIAAGSDVQVFQITSGDEVYWTSTDCQGTPQPQLTVLQPGKPISTAPIEWDRARSTAGSCDAPGDAAPSAYYWLQVKVGDLQTERDSPTNPSKQFSIE